MHWPAPFHKVYLCVFLLPSLINLGVLLFRSVLRPLPFNNQGVFKAVSSCICSGPGFPFIF